MNWSKGFSARYYISVVDRTTWRDLRRLEITGGTIKREDSLLRESADINCVNYTETTEQIIRVWLDAKQNGNSSHIPLFTGIATSPGKQINGRLVTNTVECYSVLKIAQDMLLQRGWYAPRGINGGELIRNLLSVIPVTIDIAENSPGLDSAIIAESGENRLSMADKILDLMNWRMTLDGYGNIYIHPYDREPSAIFDSVDNDVLEPSISLSYDWFGCPNVYRAVLEDSYAIARDDDPDSPLSTINRGREVWYEDNSAYLQENETLAEYANRALRAAQQTATIISYDRRFDPNVNVNDIVRLNYPEQSITGLYLVTSQTITLGYNARTSEEVVKL